MTLLIFLIWFYSVTKERLVMITRFTDKEKTEVITGILVPHAVGAW